MKKNKIFLWIVYFISPIALANNIVYSVPEDISLSQCGINALYANLRYLGIRVPLDQLYNNIKPNHNNEVNLSQLTHFAREQGLYVKGIKKPTTKALRIMLKNNSGIILQFHYSDGHFSRRHITALLRSRDNDILYIDVPLMKKILSDEQLENLVNHSQGMLVLSLKPFEKSLLTNIIISGKIWCFLSLISLLILIVTIVRFMQNRSEQTKDSFNSLITFNVISGS